LYHSVSNFSSAGATVEDSTFISTRLVIHYFCILKPSLQMSTLSPPAQYYATRHQYTCPVCNMGCGHEKRTYAKKSDNTGDIKNASPCTLSSKRPVEQVGVFQRPTAFDKHITELYEKIFRSINSNEYICALCPCNTIAHGTWHCAARFSANTAGERQTFLDHLRSHHAQGPEFLCWYHHTCCPMDTASYTDPRIRRTAESI
jgi:hypothetical protein